MSDIKDIPIEEGSGNVFEDLGFPDPEIHLLKARLVRLIGKAIIAYGLNQAQAAELMDIDQPKVSALLKGHYRGYSIERLIRLLCNLGIEVEMVAKSVLETEGPALLADITPPPAETFTVYACHGSHRWSERLQSVKERDLQPV